MPHLNKISDSYADRGLIVVAVSKENASTVEPWLQSNGVRYGNALSQSAGRAYGVRGIPNAFLISPEGVIQWRGHPGALGDGKILAVLGGERVPAAAPAAGVGTLFWVMLVFALGLFFACAVVWFWWSTRERIPRHPQQFYMPPQNGPPHGAPPPGPPQGQPPPQPPYLGQPPQYPPDQR